MRGIQRLREKAEVELREELDALRQECFQRCYRSGSDETEERGKVRKLRREIARILTILRERRRGLGRGAGVAADEGGAG
ncbi:MAG: 50S ribosomal protein L29 [Planctomycetota bacterium]